MNTFKIAVLSIASFVFVNATANIEIPMASYGVYAQTKSPVLKAGAGNMVEFYTFDGELITTLQTDFTLNFIASRLDKNAPKPRPVAYKVVYRKSFKGCSGYYVIFYDKNGNVVADYPCAEELPLAYNPNLNLSIAKKIS